MSNKNRATKIMAIFALFWILIWILGTWIMIVIGWWNNQSTDKQKTLTPEQYKELQELIKSQWWTWALNNTWSNITVTWTTISSWTTSSSGTTK